LYLVGEMGLRPVQCSVVNPQDFDALSLHAVHGEAYMDVTPCHRGVFVGVERDTLILGPLLLLLVWRKDCGPRELYSPHAFRGQECPRHMKIYPYNLRVQ
jgi:hypothetical protein